MSTTTFERPLNVRSSNVSPGKVVSARLRQHGDRSEGRDKSCGRLQTFATIYVHLCRRAPQSAAKGKHGGSTTLFIRPTYHFYYSHSWTLPGFGRVSGPACGRARAPRLTIARPKSHLLTARQQPDDLSTRAHLLPAWLGGAPTVAGAIVLHMQPGRMRAHQARRSTGTRLH